MAEGSNRRIAALALPLVAAGVLASASCYRLTATKTGSIVKDASREQGKTVTVWGTVKERIDLPRLRCYLLDDGSGTIAVVTTGRLPQVGDKVHARGRVTPALTIGRQQFVAVVEPPRPAPTPRRQPPRDAVPPS